ncbi:hypothetical protein TWF706_004250 [Orbilia oligospora]|nr:hypothetical protein TWF706_004250 [Orbilia oligospora]
MADPGIPRTLNDPKPQSPDEDVDSDSGTSIELLVSDTPIRETNFAGNLNGPTLQNSTLWVHYRIAKGSNEHKILNLGPTQFIRVLFSHIPFNLSFYCEVAGLSQADTNRIPPPGAQPAMLSPPESGSQHTDFDPEYRLVPTSTLMACFKSDIQRPTFQDPNDQRKWAFVLFVDDLFSEIAILSLYHKRPGYDPYPSLYSIPFFPVLCESSKLDEYVAVERARQGDLTNTVAMGHLMMQTRGLVLSLDSPTTTRPFYPLLILQR